MSCNFQNSRAMVSLVSLVSQVCRCTCFAPQNLRTTAQSHYIHVCASVCAPMGKGAQFVRSRRFHIIRRRRRRRGCSSLFAVSMRARQLFVNLHRARPTRLHTQYLCRFAVTQRACSETTICHRGFEFMCSVNSSGASWSSTFLTVRRRRREKN